MYFMPLEHPENPSRQIFRGDESSILAMRNLPSFSEMCICNDVDGQLSFPDEGIYGVTTHGGKWDGQKPKNEDGIYCNPAKRTIAGADGLGGEHHGELGSGLTLSSVYADTALSDIPIEEIGNRACFYLSRRFEEEASKKLGYTYKIGSREMPGATLGFARERTNGDGQKSIEGFTIGDYKAMVIDLSVRKFLFISQDQYRDPRFPTTINNWVTPRGLHLPPAYFPKIEIPRGHTVVTLLFSDGITDGRYSHEVGLQGLQAQDIFDIVLRDPDNAYIHLVNEAIRRNTPDNVSVCIMLSQ